MRKPRDMLVGKLLQEELLQKEFEKEKVYTRIVLFEKTKKKRVWEEPGMEWMKKYCIQIVDDI